MKIKQQREVKQIGRKYRLVRREAVELFKEFRESFNVDDFIRPKPRFFPRWMWFLLVNSIIVHRKK